MIIERQTRGRGYPLLPAAHCPEFDPEYNCCRAAKALMVPGRSRRMNCCTTHDYDECPIYLGKALRSSRSQGLDRDSLLSSGK